MKNIFLVIIYLLFIFSIIYVFNLKLNLNFKEYYSSKENSINNNINILNKLLSKRQIEKLENIKI